MDLLDSLWLLYPADLCIADNRVEEESLVCAVLQQQAAPAQASAPILPSWLPVKQASDVPTSSSGLLPLP